MRSDWGRGIDTQEWFGTSGFDEFNRSGAFSVPDRRAFRSSWRRLSVDGVAVGAWSTTTIAGAARPCRDVAALGVVLVVAGRFRYASRSSSCVAETDSAHVFAGGRALRFAVPGELRALLLTVPLHLFAADLRPVLGALDGPLPVSRVLSGLAGIGQQVLDPDRGGAGSPAARALRPLAVAAVEESIPGDPDAGLRARMVQYIERHLADPELGPATIARAFGISLRWAHHTFDVDGESLGRHIRHRRLELVAAQLRSDRRPPRIGALAEMAGFASRDSMTRAFRARYGSTIADYAASPPERGSDGSVRAG